MYVYININRIVIKIKEIFTCINKVNDTRVNIIAKVLSQDVLIFNHNKDISSQRKIIQIHIADDTAAIKAIVTNSNLTLKPGEELIFRNALISVIKEKLFVICDESSLIIQSKDNLLMNSSIELHFDVSSIKLSSLNFNII